MRLNDKFEDSEKEENQWEKRNRQIPCLYQYKKAIDHKIVEIPENVPLPPYPLSRIVDFGNATVAYANDDKGRPTVHFLKQHWVSGAYHWVSEIENTDNAILYPHLNPKKPGAGLEDLSGPNDIDLKDQDKYDDMNPENLGEAA